MSGGRSFFGRGPVLLPAALLGFLLLFVVYPSGAVLIRSLFVKGVAGLGNFRTFLEQPHLFRILWQSVLAACGVALCATLLGLCLSLTVFKTRMPLRSFFRAAAVVPLIIPGFVATLAYIFLFGRNGLITYKLLHLNLAVYNWKSVFLIQVMDFTTLSFFLLSAAILSIGSQGEDAARTLGASEWEVFRTVTFPLLSPGMLASGILVFMRSMADFGTPLFLGGKFSTLASASYSQLIGSYDLEMASTMSVLLLLICLTAFLVFRRVQKDGDLVRRSAGGIRKTIAFPPMVSMCIWTVSLLFSAAAFLILLSVFLAAFTKHLGASFGLTAVHFQAAFQRGWRGMTNTAVFASVTAFVVSMAGLAAAWLVTRKSFSGRRLIDLLSTVPFAIPGTFFGVGYILAFNRPPLLLAGTWFLVLILSVVREFPLGIRAGASVLAQQDRAAEDASATLGDSPVGTFFRVVLPLARPAMTVTALYAFVTTVQAVGALIFIVSPGTKLLSVDVFEAVFKGEIGMAAALSVIMICLSAAGMVAILLVSRRKGEKSWILREIFSGRML